MLTSVEDLLGRMPVFAGLSDEARGALAERLTRRPERRSSVIFEESEPGDRVFLILAGKMKISRRSTDGRENLLAVLGPGDIFGELSLFDPGPRTATATALTDVELASLEHSSLKPWLTDRPEAAELLLRVLARRLRRTNEAMGDLVFTDVPGRVAKQLLDLAERFGVPGLGRIGSGRARPHSGGARAARRRLPRDGQQVARGLCDAGLVAARQSGRDPARS